MNVFAEESMAFRLRFNYVSIEIGGYGIIGQFGKKYYFNYILIRLKRLNLKQRYKLNYAAKT